MPRFLAALVLLAAPGLAHAACTVSSVAPTNGTTVTSSPTFSWVQAGCALAALQVRPVGSMGAWSTLASRGGNGPQSYTMSESAWNAHQAGDWAAGVCWREVGRTLPSGYTYSAVRCVAMDPDLDDDGYSVGAGDCDDTNASVNPGAAELCNEAYLDDDCDGYVGEYDADGEGWRPCDGDCDDGNSSIYPTAWESCDGVDSNCDGISDTDDGDGDGYSICDGDPYDDIAAIYPGAVDVCDGYDNDSDGQTDVDPSGTLLVYQDGDYDGYGVTSITAYSLCSSAPGGWSLIDGDCNDYTGMIRPGQPELYNGIDDDCDGSIDEGLDPYASSY